MKKAYRVKKEQDFQRIIQKRQSFANRNFVLYKIKKAGQPHFHVGISVGKKVGNAVMRNRVKRQIREALFMMRDEISADYDFIVIARPAIVQLTTAEVEKNLRHICRLADILCERKEHECEN